MKKEEREGKRKKERRNRLEKKYTKKKKKKRKNPYSFLRLLVVPSDGNPAFLIKKKRSLKSIKRQTPI